MEIGRSISSLLDESDFLIKFFPKFLIDSLPILSPPTIEKPSKVLKKACPPRQIFISQHVLQKRDDLSQFFFGKVDSIPHNLIKGYYFRTERSTRIKDYYLKGCMVG